MSVLWVCGVIGRLVVAGGVVAQARLACSELSGQLGLLGCYGGPDEGIRADDRAHELELGWQWMTQTRSHCMHTCQVLCEMRKHSVSVQA